MGAGAALVMHDGHRVSLCEPGASGKGPIEPVVAEGTFDSGYEFGLYSPHMRPRWLAYPSAQAVRRAF
jgi:hypothetical protein